MDAVSRAAANVAAAPINATLMLASIALGCFSSRCDAMAVQPHGGSPLVSKSVLLLRRDLVLESSSCWCKSGSRDHRTLSTSRRADPPSRDMVTRATRSRCLVQTSGCIHTSECYRARLVSPSSDSEDLWFPGRPNFNRSVSWFHGETRAPISDKGRDKSPGSSCARHVRR